MDKTLFDDDMADARLEKNDIQVVGLAYDTQPYARDTLAYPELFHPFHARTFNLLGRFVSERWVYRAVVDWDKSRARRVEQGLEKKGSHQKREPFKVNLDIFDDYDVDLIWVLQNENLARGGPTIDYLPYTPQLEAMHREFLATCRARTASPYSMLHAIRNRRKSSKRSK